MGRQINISLPQAFSWWNLHRVSSCASVSLNQNTVFIGFVSDLKSSILSVSRVAIKALQVNSKYDIIGGCQTMKIVVSKPKLTV